MEPGSDKFAITDFPVEELRSFTEQDFLEIAVLMKVLSPECTFDKAALEAVMADPASHLFVMRHSGAIQSEPGVVANDDAGPIHRPGRIVGCCTICLFASPTGLKASVEDVALLTFFQGHGLGRLLVESSLWTIRSMVSRKAIQREQQEQRESLEPQELQEAQDPQESLGPQELQEAQDLQEALEPQELQEAQDPQEALEPQELQEAQDPQEALEPQKTQELRDLHQKFSGSRDYASAPYFQQKIHVQLTSKPQRKAANALYRSLGFSQKETNVYVLDI